MVLFHLLISYLERDQVVLPAAESSQRQEHGSLSADDDDLKKCDEDDGNHNRKCLGAAFRDPQSFISTMVSVQ